MQLQANACVYQTSNAVQWPTKRPAIKKSHKLYHVTMDPSPGGRQ